VQGRLSRVDVEPQSCCCRSKTVVVQFCSIHCRRKSCSSCPKTRIDSGIHPASIDIEATAPRLVSTLGSIQSQSISRLLPQDSYRLRDPSSLNRYRGYCPKTVHNITHNCTEHVSTGKHRHNLIPESMLPQHQYKCNVKNITLW
jgi:hypothetical protein